MTGGNPNHGPDGKFASGQSSTGVTRTARERQAILAMIDKRKFAPGRTSNRNITPNADAVARQRIQSMGLHSIGIHNATAGKTLAQVSAMGATQANIKSGENQ